MKNVIVLTNPTNGYDEYIRNIFKIINYGNVSNKIFMEDVVQYDNYNFDDSLEGYKKIVNYFQNSSDEMKKNLKVDTGKCMFYQRIVSIYKSYPNENYYIACLSEVKTTCAEDYFYNLAFKDYIKNKNGPSDGGPAYFIFSDYGNEEDRLYPNLTIKDNLDENYGIPKLYFSLDGEYLGETEEEAEAKLNENQNNETQPQPETVIEQNNTATPEVKTENIIENTVTNNTTNILNNNTTNTIQNNTILNPNNINENNTTITE